MDGPLTTTVKLDQQRVSQQAAASPQRICNLFGRVLTPEYFESLKTDLQIVENQCVFTLPVTVWTMMLQRLSSKGTLAGAVADLVGGAGGELLQDCKRVREGRISSNPGAFCQARKRLPKMAAMRIAQRSFSGLLSISATDDIRDRVFVLDGSSIRLPHTDKVLATYGPAENQYGKSHWPVMRIAVMHHVRTGLAMPPEFGPMYGPNKVSEQVLAEALIGRLPPSSILIGDRNFGVFSVVWRAHQRGHAAIVRLTASRAAPLVRKAAAAAESAELKAAEFTGTEYNVTWRPTSDDRSAHPELAGTAQAGIPGRLIVANLPHMQEPLYLFTTLNEPAARIVRLYGERWSVETDLRSLKSQVRLQTIAARSPDLIACELMMAVTTYNFVRATMSAAAKQLDIEPRRLSFSRSQDLVLAFTRTFANCRDQHEFDQQWSRLMRALAQCKLPERNRPPAPRKVWPKPQPFPYRSQPQ